MIKKRLITLCFMTAALSFITSCANKGTASSALLVYCKADEKDMYDALADMYKLNKPDVPVEIRTYNEGEGVNQADKADIISGLSFNEAQTLGLSKKLSDIGGLPEERTIDYLLLSDKDGIQYSLPLSGNVSLIYYNQAKFALSGIPKPETLGSFGSLFTIFKEEGIRPMAFSVNASGQYDTLYFADGFTLNAPGGFKGAVDADGQLNSGIYDIESMARMMIEDIPAREDSPKDHAALVELFKSGSIAMIPGSSADAEKLDRTLFGYFIAPGNDNSRNVGWHSTAAVALSASSKKTKEAKDFITFLLSNDAQKYISDKTNSLPAIRGINVKDSLESVYEELQYTDGAAVTFFDRISQSDAQQCKVFFDSLFSSNEEVKYEDFINGLKDGKNK